MGSGWGEGNARNPKNEIRNKHEHQNNKRLAPKVGSPLPFRISSFGFVSDFEIRISYFFPPSLPDRAPSDQPKSLATCPSPVESRITAKSDSSGILTRIRQTDRRYVSGDSRQSALEVRLGDGRNSRRGRATSMLQKGHFPMTRVQNGLAGFLMLAVVVASSVAVAAITPCSAKNWPISAATPGKPVR